MSSVIRELRPTVVIIENVTAISIRGLTGVLSSLAEIGYDAEWQPIRASDIGAPHRRERMWIVAYPREIGRLHSTHERETIVHKIPGQWTQDTSAILLHNEWDGERGDNVDIRIRPWISRELDRLAALGNAIVPQIAEILFRQIKIITNMTSFV